MHERPNDKILAAGSTTLAECGSSTSVAERSRNNTSELEMEIDLLVYHFYRLSFEEAKVIDNSLTEEEFGKEEVR